MAFDLERRRYRWDGGIRFVRRYPNPLREQSKPRMLWFEPKYIPSGLCTPLTDELRQHPVEIILVHWAHSRRFVEKSDFRTQVRDATRVTTFNLV